MVTEAAEFQRVAAKAARSDFKIKHGERFHASKPRFEKRPEGRQLLECPSHPGIPTRCVASVASINISLTPSGENGAKARSILMSILATAKKRLGSDTSIEQWFAKALDRIALENVEPASLLPPVPG